MQIKNLLVLLSSALLIFACSSSKPKEEAASTASLDLLQKGFLLSLPEEEAWQVVKKTDYKVLLTRTGETGSYTIQTLVVTLPTFEEDADFQQFLQYIKGRMDESNAGNNVMESDTSIFTGNNENCIQHSNKQGRTQKGKAVTLETVSFTCRHPNNPSAGVYMALSKSYEPGASQENMLEKATELFNRLYFTEL